MKPFIYYSSEVVKGFIADLLNRSMDDFAIQLEAYVMTGLKGTHQPPPVLWPNPTFSSRCCHEFQDENA